MNRFRLKIQTMDGQVLDAPVQRVVFRTIAGDVAIMAGHCNYCTAVGMGLARVTMEDGSVKEAACIGGMVSMHDNECHLLPTSWEWADQIDAARAEASRARAEETLARQDLDARELELAQARLKRALVRTSVARM